MEADRTGIDEHPVTVTAALPQVLAGIELVAAPACTSCRRSFLPGQDVTVYAYRRVREAHWHVPSVYCPSCERTTVDAPTAGWAEALVTAALVVTDGTSRINPTAVIA